MESWHPQISSELANARRRAVPKVPWVSRRPPISLPPSSFLWPEVCFVPILSSVARISNWLSWPYRILGPADPELLGSDPNQDHLYSQIHSLTIRWVTIVTSNIWTLSLQWLRSPPVREPQLSSTRCCLASLETGSGAHNFYLKYSPQKTGRYS